MAVTRDNLYLALLLMLMIGGEALIEMIARMLESLL